MRNLVAILGLGVAGCSALSTPPSGEPDFTIDAVHSDAAHMNADYWIRKSKRPDRIVLDRAAIEAQNARLQRIDPSIHDIENLPATLDPMRLRTMIVKLSQRPDRALFDERGVAVGTATLDALESALNLDAIKAQPTRYGLIVQRADMRTFPTTLRVFTTNADIDIDRFQESALFPGTPVVIAHESRDRRWYFVVSTLYAAWVQKERIAVGTAQDVLDYARKTPYLVITGSAVRTVFTHEQPQVSELQLEMGVRVPSLAAWPADQLVNGQHPRTAQVIELPIRAADGTLLFTPALLPTTADSAFAYLPLNRSNLLRQSFKFLGERYGWGHSNNARDCSGFVSEVYRSFGVTLPRNTGDQALSPAFDRIAFSAGDSRAARLATLRELQAGDLIFIPGHVMMVIGHEHGMPYVIHDAQSISYRDGDRIVRVPLNAVSVTALSPALLSDDVPLIDRIYSIQRMR